MARRRVAESLRPRAGIPSVLMEYAESGGFWDSPERVKLWCMSENLEPPPEQYFDYPPGLRQWCIDAWGKREGHFNRFLMIDMSKIQELGIWRGYGRDSSRARRPYLFTAAELNAWRPISAPGSKD